MATYLFKIKILIMLFVAVFLFVGNAFAFMDMEELKSVYYGMDILNEPVVLTEDVPVGALQVTSKFGQQYQCTFPDHSTEDKKKEEEEKIAKETGIVEMLKPMGLKDCLFKTKDWWSYEFCYGKYIRQFHMEDGDIKGNIIYLGYYESDFDWDNETAREDRLKSKVSMSRYHSQTYTLGTKCDLTNQMRRTEVRFMCEENSEDYLYRIDESETCVYTVTVMTSKICRHPYLKAPIKRKPVPITCSPLLTEDQYQDFLAEKEEKNKKNAKKEEESALQSKGTLLWEQELQETLDNEMSNTAKHLLTQSTDELFSPKDAKLMSKEEFEKLFGDDENLWELYLRGTEITRKQHSIKLLKESKTQNTEPIVGEDAADAEDEEILSKFDDEIQEIKKKFESSQTKLGGIKKKLTLDRQWESEIESAIREAEGELGVKVDRSLISGLSNTLDKLFNKLQDTEAELSNMNKEIGKLQPGSKDGGTLQPDSTEESKDSRADEGEGLTAEEVQKPVKEDVNEDVLGTDEDESDDSAAGLDDKVLAPPKTLSKHSGSAVAEVKNEDVPKSSDNKHGVDTPPPKDGAGALQKVEKENTLPENIQKLLEESVLKEYQKHKLQQDDPKPLRFDTDHSFTKEKMFHVIQQEDEEGKTNRFIFVFGFNTFNDESAENERQSSLEENYSFVYKGKKSKNSRDPSS